MDGINNTKKTFSSELETNLENEVKRMKAETSPSKFLDKIEHSKTTNKILKTRNCETTGLVGASNLLKALAVKYDADNNSKVQTIMTGYIKLFASLIVANPNTSFALSEKVAQSAIDTLKVLVDEQKSSDIAPTSTSSKPTSSTETNTLKTQSKTPKEQSVTVNAVKISDVSTETKSEKSLNEQIQEFTDTVKKDFDMTDPEVQKAFTAFEKKLTQSLPVRVKIFNDLDKVNSNDASISKAKNWINAEIKKNSDTAEASHDIGSAEEKPPVEATEQMTEQKIDDFMQKLESELEERGIDLGNPKVQQMLKFQKGSLKTTTKQHGESVMTFDEELVDPFGEEALNDAIEDIANSYAETKAAKAETNHDVKLTEKKLPTEKTNEERIDGFMKELKNKLTKEGIDLKNQEVQEDLRRVRGMIAQSLKYGGEEALGEQVLNNFVESFVDDYAEIKNTPEKTNEQKIDDFMLKMKNKLTEKGVDLENQEVQDDLKRARGITSRSFKNAGEKALGEQILNNFVEDIADNYAETEAKVASEKKSDIKNSTSTQKNSSESKSIAQKTGEPADKNIDKTANLDKTEKEAKKEPMPINNANSLKQVSGTDDKTKITTETIVKSFEDLADLHRKVNETGQTVIIKGITREFLEKLRVEEDDIEEILSDTNEEPVLICSPDKGEQVLGPCIPIFSKDGKFDGVYDIWENAVWSESEFCSPFDEEAEDELGPNYFNKVSMQEGFADAEQLVVGNDGAITKSDTTDVPSGLKKWLTNGINKKEIENKIKTLESEIETLEGQVDDDGYVKLNQDTYSKKEELEKLKSVLEPDSSLSKEDIEEKITNKFKSRIKNYKIEAAAKKIELNTTQNVTINGRKLPQYSHMRPWYAGDITENDIKNYGTGNENDLSANNYQNAYGIVPETLQLLDAVKAQNLSDSLGSDSILNVAQYLQVSYSKQIHRLMDNFERACAQVSIESSVQKDALLAIVANAKNSEKAYNAVIEKPGFREINDLAPDSLKNAVNAAFGLVRKFTNASALSDMDMSIIANTLGNGTVLVSKDRNGKDIPYEKNINLFIKGDNGRHIPVIQNRDNELLTKDETGKYTKLPEGTQLFMPTYMIRYPNYEDEEEIPVTVDINKNEVYSTDGKELSISDRRDPISSPCLFPVSGDLGRAKNGVRSIQFSFDLNAYEDENTDIMRDERDPIHCYHNEFGKLVYRQKNEEITIDPSKCLQFTEDYRPYIPS